MAVQRIRCAVADLIPHGDRVYTMALTPEQAAPRFRAGQFLHLALDPYEPGGFWPDSRAFSIASSPTERNHLRITYSVQGRFTGRMERELAAGRDVWIKMPYGDFVVDGDGELVLVAGGTGITAFSAFIEQLTPSPARSVTLAYGARDEALLVYRELVERAVRKGALSALYFVEHGRGGAATGPLAGRVSLDAVWPRLERPLDAHYFLSGPPAMLSAVHAQLNARQVPERAIHTDAWE